MCQYPESLDTKQTVRNKTNIHSSDILSLNPHTPVFLPGMMVHLISGMNTQWHHFLETLDQRQSCLPSYPFLQTIAHSHVFT